MCKRNDVNLQYFYYINKGHVYDGQNGINGMNGVNSQRYYTMDQYMKKNAK